MAWGWKLSYSKSSNDMDYTDLDETPYATKAEAYEAAEEASSSRHLGAQMNNAYGNPDKDPGPSQIEVFKV